MFPNEEWPAGQPTDWRLPLCERQLRTKVVQRKKSNFKVILKKKYLKSNFKEEILLM